MDRPSISWGYHAIAKGHRIGMEQYTYQQIHTNYEYEFAHYPNLWPLVHENSDKPGGFNVSFSGVGPCGSKVGIPFLP